MNRGYWMQTLWDGVDRTPLASYLLVHALHMRSAPCPPMLKPHLGLPWIVGRNIIIVYKFILGSGYCSANPRCV